MYKRGLSRDRSALLHCNKKRVATREAKREATNSLAGEEGNGRERDRILLNIVSYP